MEKLREGVGRGKMALYLGARMVWTVLAMIGVVVLAVFNDASERRKVDSILKKSGRLVGRDDEDHS